MSLVLIVTIIEISKKSDGGKPDTFFSRSAYS